ncbi:MAG: transposase [Shimia sp.]
MEGSKFRKQQVFAILQDRDAGAKTADVARPKHRISSATFYVREAKYGVVQVSDARRLKALEASSEKLKRLYAEAMRPRARNCCAKPYGAMDSADPKDLLG